MQRQHAAQMIEQAFSITPCVAILGPRQCGKTTLAREIARQKGIPNQNYFDLERPSDIERLANPELTLSHLSGLLVIDEIQAIPELFPTLRVLIDDPTFEQQYLILGSASRELIRQSSETLAGRLTYQSLTPFTYLETQTQDTLWLRGGFPRAYLAETDEISFNWRKAYIKTYLEQDIPKLGITIPAENLRRFWMMLAHAQGASFNASDIGRSLGLTNKTISHYLDILTGTFMVRPLKPWFENISKRQVKTPKVYIRDTGILHALLGIQSQAHLLTHPKLGISWESYALEQIITTSPVDPEDCYYWATHQGAELDLLFCQADRRIGFEIKYAGAPKLTKSMKVAIEDLKLDQLYVIYPGKIAYPLAENIDAVPLTAYLDQFNL